MTLTKAELAEQLFERVGLNKREAKGFSALNAIFRPSLPSITSQSGR
jgi:nucleoid DNA-binding protein